MIYSSILTQKGQATIPLDLREYLQLVPYEPVFFEKRENEVVLSKAKTLLDLRGSIKTSKKFDDRKADAFVLKYAKKRYAQKLSRS